jgi:hypothetical protein
MNLSYLRAFVILYLEKKLFGIFCCVNSELFLYIVANKNAYKCFSNINIFQLMHEIQ